MNFIGIHHEVRLIYKAAIEAVKPASLISRKVRCTEDRRIIFVGDEEIKAENRKCYVVGFGKAVLSMAVKLENILKEHVHSGVLSIPHGVLAGSQQNLTQDFLSKYKIHQGAVNNIPDEDSLKATLEIKEKLSSLTNDDILFILISGGGSALLSSPIDGLSLEDKQKTIQLLSRTGAYISELNTVRKRLSSVKGGKLARMVPPGATVISLILSDVIGDPLDIIASGPTVEDRQSEGQAWAVLQKYHLEDLIPSNVTQILTRSPASQALQPLDDVRNILIGNNSTALAAAESLAAEQGFATIVLSDRIQGDARTVGQHFAGLARLVKEMMTHPGEHKFIDELSLLLDELGVDPATSCRLEKLARICYRDKKNLCLLAGGESTVTVIGRGRGGRNQEMALAWAVDMDDTVCQQSLVDVTFLSAGTDGIDGPTDAAGAYSHPGLVQEAISQGLDPRSYLIDNDSYNFFRALGDGKYHLIVGPTGTNVMDVHVLCFNWRSNPIPVETTH